jgi:hypothetical protein
MSFLRRGSRGQHAGCHPNGGNTKGQELVRAHFRSTLPIWSELYDEKDVYRRIYKQRMDAVLEMVDGLPLSAHSRTVAVRE